MMHNFIASHWKKQYLVLDLKIGMLRWTRICRHFLRNIFNYEIKIRIKIYLNIKVIDIFANSRNHLTKYLTSMKFKVWRNHEFHWDKDRYYQSSKYQNDKIHIVPYEISKFFVKNKSCITSLEPRHKCQEPCKDKTISCV